MRHIVLADTGPLYAAVDRDDTYHTQAQAGLERLESDGYTVAVAYSTLAEAYTLILHRLGLSVAHAWLNDVQRGALLLNPSVEDYMAAMACIQAYSDQPLTLCDAVLACVSARLDCPVWTYDHHFDLLHAAVWR